MTGYYSTYERNVPLASSITTNYKGSSDAKTMPVDGAQRTICQRQPTLPCLSGLLQDEG